MDNINDVDANSDDDLQLLGSPPSLRTRSMADSTTGENASSGTLKSKRKNIEGESGSDLKKSKVWAHFTNIGLVDGVLKCQCKHCNKFYTCRIGAGTSHLGRHLEKCIKTPKLGNLASMFDNQAVVMKKWKFDSTAYRDSLSKSIVKHDLPFSYAEYEGVNASNKILNPEFHSISRNTAKSDCSKLYMAEKQKLKSLLASLPGRICLTSDVWTSVTTKGYMTVTAHFVDENWKLNSKLLSFCNLDCVHSGLELSSKLLDVLKDWGIESKIFSITLDNASNNDNMVKTLIERLNLRKGLLCRGEFFHIRCCAHVLNLIVQDGLKVAVEALNRIRKSVKYVKASEGRLREFQKCVDDVNLNDVGGSFLILDVPTRWNSTFMMLESAIKYRRAFTCLRYSDRNYTFCPTDEEWDRGEKICAFLAPFYHITNLLSGSLYPTSNLYFMQVASIEMKLREFVNSEEEVIKEMAVEMKKKFFKYWEEYSVTLAFGSILDPKAKLQFLSFCYKRLDPGNFQEKVDRVKEALYRLFDEYDQVGASSNSSKESKLHSTTNGSSSSNPKSSILDEYHQQMRKMTSCEGRFELDIYLGEECITDVDVLDYWKVNKHRFPRLAIMACDVLSIPITTVASESTFSIGGRILHKYRASLLPETVQTLICTRNLLHGFKEVEALEMKELEERRSIGLIDIEDLELDDVEDDLI